MNAREQSEDEALRKRHLAAKTKTALVQCGTFQCLAYVDVDGKWKSYFGDKELTGEVREVGNF